MTVTPISSLIDRNIEDNEILEILQKLLREGQVDAILEVGTNPILNPPESGIKSFRIRSTKFPQLQIKYKHSGVRTTGHERSHSSDY